jgi:LytS/YehU family sensor histidine kinase
MLFSYGFNKLWYAKFPLWLSIYILVIGFTHIIRKSQLIQQKKAKAHEDQLAELQLGAVSTYLDPHFTFNTLNTITSLIYKEEKVKAHEVITRFTSLIRSTLMQSGKVSRSLGEELEFVKNYLDIQRFRFGNSFTWEIRNEDNIDLSLPVPKMMVHQYVENAIKHGLKNKGAGGKLHIILLRQDKETIVVIRDNGVGRDKAKIYNEPGTGKGLLTMQQIFDLFEKTNKIKISPTINDLMDDSGNSSGTEVILTIRKV